MAAAAAVVAVVVGVAGCGNGGAAGGSASSPTHTAAAAGAGVSPSDTSGYTTVPYTTPSALPTPSTPEDRIDRQADAHAWTYDTDTYSAASEEVQDVCDTLDSDSTDPDFSSSPAEWLGTYGFDRPQRELISYGVPLLCPTWTKTVAQAWAGQWPVWMSAGTYKVSSHRTTADDTVPPGTYRTNGDLEGCYWERARADGTIIANHFATAATSITVTIRPSDDLFTSRGCGVWKPVH